VHNGVEAHGTAEPIFGQLRRARETWKWRLMSGPSISHDVAIRLASYVEARRRDLVGSVIGSTALPRPGSIAASVFTNAFFDRLCQELEVGDRDAIDLWIDRESDADSSSEHARIVVIACATLSSAYVAECGHSDEIVAYLALRSGDIDRRIRADRAQRRRAVDPATLVSKDDVVASLLSAIEARDSATCDHSRAVGMWCGRIAKTMGMSAEQQTFAVLAGTLHDVGKIATPTEILLKPGPLSVDEWVTMSSHAAVGGGMLERVASLKDLSPVVRAHHERLDGTGYPDRLGGDDIPVIARVIAVADSFHAMISKRPYRQPLPVPRALDELRAGSGTQWDPTIVSAMLSIVQPARQAQPTLRAVRGTGGD